MTIDDSSYNIGEGSINVNGVDRYINEDQYSALAQAASDAGFNLKSIDLSKGEESFQDIYRAFKELDIEFSYIADDEKGILLGSDFDLDGKLSDYAAAFADKFLQQNFLEPIIKSIISDAQSHQQRMKNI